MKQGEESSHPWSRQEGFNASLFARDAGWNSGHVLLAARAEDKTDAGLNSTHSVWLAKYKLSDGVVNFLMPCHFPPVFSDLTVAHNFPFFFFFCYQSLSVSCPTFFHFYCIVIASSRVSLDLLFLLFMAFSLLSWAIFHYPWPGLKCSVNAIWLPFHWIVKSSKIGNWF